MIDQEGVIDFCELTYCYPENFISPGENSKKPEKSLMLTIPKF